MDRLGIEYLSALGLPPVEFVKLTAALGCRHISTGFTAGVPSPVGYPPFNLKEDVKLRGEMIAAMRDLGVSISLFEGMSVQPGRDIRERAPDLDILQELGVTRVNIISFDPDLARAFDQFAVGAEMAAGAGMESVSEFVPGFTVPDLPTALAAVRHVGRPDFRLLVDVMHLARSGGTAADLAAIDPGLIGYVHLSDVPLVPIIPGYFEEATCERRAPGAGELPLLDMLAAVPPHVVVGLEVPEVAKAMAGVGPRERLGPVVEAARSILAKAYA
jgi:sugar phosphate isomerase/epimerase